MKKVNCVAFFFSLMPLAVTYTLPDDCTFLDTSLTCQQSIPTQLPPGVQNVYITDYPDDDVGKGRFAHISWRSVKQFDINANVEIYLYITDYVFLGLENMTALGIHARRGNTIQEKAFVGIDLLEKLDFSNMISLESETLITPLLYGKVLPSLRILILENVNTGGYQNFYLSRSFFLMLRAKSITELSMRGTNLFIEENVNDISTVVQILDFSNVSFSFIKGHFVWDDVFPTLINLNVSSPVTRYLEFIRPANRKDEYCHEYNPVYRTLETFDASFFSDDQVYINNVSLNISEPCLQSLKILHLRGSKIRFFNATLHVPTNVTLRELDLSSNGMHFLSATVLKELINLENLYLGDNLLSSMSNHPDFKILFQTLHKLKRLSLANNQITYIPEQMFLHNLDLQWLDLQGNYLTSTSFLHLQLSNLVFLNISDNRIAYIVGDDLEKLQMIIARKGSKMKEIKMSANPFECSCESVNFIEWVNKKPVNGDLQYTCNFGKETTTINNKSIAKAKFLCIRTIVYTISCVLSVTVALILLITSVLTWRYLGNKRRADKLKIFLNKFQKERLHEQFLCFLSYSDTDVKISTKLYNKLEALLKDITKCERDMVGINDKHFRAGVPIVEEIIRCMSESLVAVFVVSEAFCQSNWCCVEVREAYEQQKPIILIFVEEVSEENMTIYVRNIFQRYTRGKLVMTEHGDVDFLPGGLKGLCYSIVLLASRGGRDRRHIKDIQV